MNWTVIYNFIMTNYHSMNGKCVCICIFFNLYCCPQGSTCCSDGCCTWTEDIIMHMIGSPPYQTKQVRNDVIRYVIISPAVKCY